MGNNRNIWLFGNANQRILNDKNALIQSHIQYMLSKTMSMFEYKNLPETIPAREIELIMQMCKFAIFTKVDGQLYVFYGGLGGQPNEYFQPTQAIVTNPYLRYSDVLTLGDNTGKTEVTKDGKRVNAVVIWNDESHVGLYPLFLKNAELLSECEITLKYILVNHRINNVLTADDDNTKDSIEEMYKTVERGDGFAVVSTKKFIDESSIGKIETKNASTTSSLKDVIETIQYIKGSWFNDLGLNANFNMKREAINESESDMNEDALLPFIDDMLKCRQNGWKLINELFDENVEVELSSSWKKIRKEIQLHEEQQETEIHNEEQLPTIDSQSEVNEEQNENQ